MSLLLFFALFGLSSSECPDSWFPLGRHCYHISEHQLGWESSEEVVRHQELSSSSLQILPACSIVGVLEDTLRSLNLWRRSRHLIWFWVVKVTFGLVCLMLSRKALGDGRKVTRSLPTQIGHGDSQLMVVLVEMKTVVVKFARELLM